MRKAKIKEALNVLLINKSTSSDFVASHRLKVVGKKRKLKDFGFENWVAAER